MNDLIKFIVVVIVLTTIFLYIDTKNSNLIYQKAELDGKMYLVRNVADKAKAANLIASIRQK